MDNINAFISFRKGTRLFSFKVQSKFTTGNNFTFGAIFSAQKGTYGEGNNTNIGISKRNSILVYFSVRELGLSQN